MAVSGVVTDATRRGPAKIRTYASFVKFEHTLFSLPLIYAGAVLAAQGWPTLVDTLLILAAASAARTAALSMNRIIDRQLDARNPRTRNRALPAGRMTIGEARMVVVISVVIYLISAALLGRICLLYAPIPLLLFVGYPYLKRFTPLAHLGLGIAWGAAPVAGWLAVAKTFDQSMAVWILALFCCLWVAGFDVIYATQDETSDRAQGVHSLPAAWGRERALDIAMGAHVVAFVVLAVLYGLALRGGLSFGLLMCAGLLLMVEHSQRDEVELAFFRVNAILGFVVLGLILTGVTST